MGLERNLRSRSSPHAISTGILTGGEDTETAFGDSSLMKNALRAAAFCYAWVLLAASAAAVDLTQIDRSIGKEPAYRSKDPQFCLLVFGLEAKTRVWIVVDGDVLWIDRNGNGHSVDHAADPGSSIEEERLSNRDEIERLLEGLNGQEAEVIRLYHLEGKSYREISREVGMPENSIGPTLTRARAKMRQVKAQADSSAS